MDFNFLKNLAPAVVEEKQRAPKTSIKAVPEGVDFRVSLTGNIYLNARFVEEFNLQYKHKEDTDKGNGIDIVESWQWSQYPKDAPDVLFFAISNRKYPKLDLYNSTKYNEDGSPKGDVLTQIQKVDLNIVFKALFSCDYNEETAKEHAPNGYLDLVLVRGIDFTPSNGKFYLPKEVSRGENKGEYTTSLRESISLYPVTIFEAVNEAADVELSPQSEIGIPKEDINPIETMPEEELLSL